jgi:hypothetical protein
VSTEDKVDSIARRIVPIGMFMWTIVGSMAVAVTTGAVFHTNVVNADREHDRRLSSLEAELAAHQRARQRIERNIVRIGSRLGVRDLEEPE